MQPARKPWCGFLVEGRQRAEARPRSGRSARAAPTRVPVLVSNRFLPGDLLLGEAEHVVVELRQALLREGAAVCALQVLEHPLLACEIDEADPVLLLVALQLRDELQPLVHQRDERRIEIRDLSSHLQDVRVLGH